MFQLVRGAESGKLSMIFTNELQPTISQCKTIILDCSIIARIQSEYWLLLKIKTQSINTHLLDNTVLNNK